MKTISLTRLKQARTFALVPADPMAIEHVMVQVKLADFWKVFENEWTTEGWRVGDQRGSTTNGPSENMLAVFLNRAMNLGLMNPEEACVAMVNHRAQSVPQQGPFASGFQHWRLIDGELTVHQKEGRLSVACPWHDCLSWYEVAALWYQRCDFEAQKAGLLPKTEVFRQRGLHPDGLGGKPPGYQYMEQPCY